MTGDEAREAFDAAFEGELDPAARAAFEAALAEDAALRDEYEDFARTLRALRGIGVRDSEVETPQALVEGVERKLRVRSRGRFYRDRYASARREERVLPFILAVVVFVLLIVAIGGRRVVVLPSSQGSSAPR